MAILGRPLKNEKLLGLALTRKIKINNEMLWKDELTPHLGNALL